MSRNITTTDFSLFKNLHLHSCIFGSGQLDVTVSKPATVQIQKIIAVFYLQLAIKSSIDVSIHHLYRTPHLPDGVITPLLLVMRAYDAISTKVSHVVDKTVLIRPFHSFIG